jgi:CO/xanthine dehydrogenase Mo-binding subunit
MGQGARTVLPMLASEALGLPLERIRYHQPDTSAVPDSGPTVASRTTMVVGRILVSACEDLLRQVKETAGEGDDAFARAAAAGLTGHGVYEHDERIVWDQERHRGDAYQAWSWGAVGLEVDVDLDTFEVHPRHCCFVVEIGRAVNPVLCVGQVEGGALQGLAWGCIEEIKTAGGRYLNDRMSTCIIPTSLDAPDFDVELLELPSDRGPYGAKGLGELPMNGGAPALAAAVADALGFDVAAAPATPDYLLVRSREARA